jgi:large subunit ribosomal protein L4
MKVSVYNVKGDVVGDVELSDAVFGVPANVPLMHQAVVQHLANRRVGTASTKTRAVIAGTTKKMYKQKGTGRARHGSRKVPLWTGGGVAHGPHPRSYQQYMPKKMRRASVKSALSVKARDNQIVVLDELTIAEPRTKEMLGILAALPINGKVLLSVDALAENVLLSTRNIPRLRCCPATALNTYDLLNHDYLVTTVPALRQVEQWLTTNGKAKTDDGAADEKPARRPRARAETPAADAEAPAAVEEAPKPRSRARAAATSEAPVAEEAPGVAEETPAADEKPARAPRTRKKADAE